MKFTAIDWILLCLVTFLVLSHTVSAKHKCKSSSQSDDGSERINRCTKGKSRQLNNKGSKSEKKLKAVKRAPFWKKGPPKRERIVREGKKVSLSCNIKGNPTPQFHWLRNGKALPHTSDNKFRTRRHRLIIQNILIDDMGTYTCIAKNLLGALNFTYSLRILENIRFKSIDIVERPENQTAHVGDTVIFLCRSEDFPKPSVQWTRLTTRSRIIESVTSSSRIPDDGVFVLRNVTKADAGVYTCFIGNERTHRELSAHLTVIDEGERLPYEPPCALHVRRQVLVDHIHGCRSSIPVDMHYCMGSCGRSYYIPQMLTEDSNNASFLNQTCGCCVGIVESLRIVELDCSLGQKKKGFYTLLRGCQCKQCEVKDNHSISNADKTPS